MALDTPEKRANVPGVGRPWYRTKSPQVSLDEQWRIASGNAYGGNALSVGTSTVLDFGRGFCRGYARGMSRGMH